MKTQLFFFSLLLLVGCSGESSNKTTAETEASDSTDENANQEAERIIFDAVGAEEGYDSDLYIYPKDQNIKKPGDLPEFTDLHVVPDYTAADGLNRDMVNMYQSNFHLYNLFETFSGKVVVFFDKEKRHKAIVYSAVNGKPDGIVRVYTPKGRIFMEREYKNGKWTKSMAAPACSDWSFNQANSSLTIRDIDNGKKTVNGRTSIALMPGINYAYEDYEKILDKSTYQRSFTINGKPYTGSLTAHYKAPEGEPTMRFELNFKNGLLDGDVKVYSEFFGLSLHEIFSEGNLTSTVYVQDPSEMDGMAKPIIYLYPEDTTDVLVQLDLKGTLTHTYPRYHSGWSVTACPDGTLFDANNKEYYALYWEGQNDRPFTLNEGTVVKGENTIEFLESALKTLGLNRREANEFIMYWLPRMENNAYNLIHFSTDEYEDIAQLNITPKPETMIRVMMVFQPLKSEITIPRQNLDLLKKERKGFTAVEWGGKEVQRVDF